MWLLAHHTSSLLLNGPIYTNALDDEPKLNTSHNEPNNNLDMLDTGYSTANKIIAADEKNKLLYNYARNHVIFAYI